MTQKTTLQISEKTKSDAGFTLLELLVVLAIMGMLAAIIGPQVVRYLGSSRSQTAKVQIQNISAALELYRLDVGRYPSAEEGLAALVKPPASQTAWNGPYMQQATALVDPWGKAYQYRMPGKETEADIYTYGSDGAQGGTKEAKDVGNW
jgi:general secretion pathway protein G